MTVDFSLWLMVLVGLCVVVLMIDRLFFKAARLERQISGQSEVSPSEAIKSSTSSSEPILVEYARSFFPVLCLVLVVRSFIFEPFRIPSDSMMPTLLAGDFIFVSKFSYDLRLPVFNTKILETGDPKRGDVIVFKLPADPRINYIKRLVGMPGDHVVVSNDEVFINGQKAAVVIGSEYNEYGYANARTAIEDLGGVKHQVMFLDNAFTKDFDGVVPAGKYLFMGDNRDNSQDGRFPQVGYVPEENLVGKAKLVWFHWKFTELPIFSRIGMLIH